LTPDERQRAFFLHPERQAAAPTIDPALQQRRTTWAAAVVGGSDESSLVSRLGDVAAPSLVISGDSDLLFPPASNVALAERLRATSVVVPDAAHGVQTDQAEVFATHVRDFLTNRAPWTQ
jgi:pimeloyl-ACP methyl ester carboxylesterase